MIDLAIFFPSLLQIKINNNGKEKEYVGIQNEIILSSEKNE